MDAAASTTQAVVAPQAVGPLSCATGNLYNLDTKGNLYSVSSTTGANTKVTKFTLATADFNGLGITTGGTKALVVNETVTGTKTRIYQYVATTGTKTHYTVSAAGLTYVVAGGVDPVNDLFYYGGFNTTGTFLLFAFNAATDAAIGEVGTITVPTTSAGAFADGDLAFDGKGNLYFVASVGKTANGQVFRVDVPIPAVAGTQALNATEIAAITATFEFDGIALNVNGYVYLQTPTTKKLVKVNPNGSVAATIAETGLATRAVPTDLASCSYPGTVTGEVNIAGRHGATNQFTVKVTGDGISKGNTGTTSGSSTGLQTGASEIAGPVLALPTDTYTVSQVAATGTGTTLGNYDVAYSCRSNTTVIASGTGSSVKLQFPASTTSYGAVVVCTFTDTPVVAGPHVTVAKTQATSTPVTTAGQTIHYQFSVKNTGSVPLKTVKVTDTQSVAGETLATGPTCPSTSLAVGGSETCTASYVVSTADIAAKKVADSAVAKATGTPTGTTVTSPKSTLSIPVSAAIGPVMSCTSTPNLFNTGYDKTTKKILPTKAITPNWQVAGMFPPPATHTVNSPPPATATWGVTYVGRLAPTAYAPSPYTNAQWISQQTLTHKTSGTGNWYYRYRFTLSPTAAPTRFALAIDYLADNSVSQVYVNGVAQSTYTSGLPQSKIGTTTTPANGTTPYYFKGYKSKNAAKLLLDHDWHTGPNTIVVEVKSFKPEEAFDAQMRPSILCPTMTVTKSVAGRVNPADQFTVDLKGQTGTTLASVTTTGTETTATSPAGPTRVGSTYSITDVMAAGSPDPITDYTATLTCKNTISGTSVASTSTGSSSAPSWTVKVTTPASYTCTVTNTPLPVAALSITKTRAATTTAAVTAVGQTIKYDFLVTNTGNVTLHTVKVTDTQSVTGETLATGPTCPSATLAPAKTETCTATYKVTQVDLDNGYVEDTAKVTAKTPATKTVTKTSTALSVATTTTAALSITKTRAATTTAAVTAVGQTIKYDFLVTNTGNVTLHTVKVTDTQSVTGETLATGPTCPSATLAPAKTETCTATYKVTQVDLDNGYVEDTAKVTAKTPATKTVSGTTSPLRTAVVRKPAIALAISVDPSSFSRVGTVLTYSFVVTNTGNVDLEPVVVSDPMPGLSAITCPATSLAPGMSETCTATYHVTAQDLATGSIQTTATATGTSAVAAAVQATASTTLQGKTAAAISLTKSANVESAAVAGQTILYDFVVTNTGNVTLHTVKVTDTQSVTGETLATGPTCPSATLAAGAKETCTGTFVVTAANMTAGQITDTATASAISANGTVATSPPSSATVLTGHPTSIITGGNSRHGGDGPLELGGLVVFVLGVAALLVAVIRRRSDLHME